MNIKNFDYFKVGTVFNPIGGINGVKPVNKEITILYPTRLNAMAIDPSKIVENNNMKYTPGEVVFSTQIFIEITVKIIDENKIYVNKEMEERESVVKHACLIMKEALGYTKGFEVNIKNYHNLKHCGLGSTGCIQAGIAAAINHIFGKPISPETLVKYLAQNYGEEIDGDIEYLNPVQCIGGSAASGLMEGGVLILAGENTVVASGNISDEYTVLIGIPLDYSFCDSKTQFEEEKENLEKFFKCGEKYRFEIAYNILHYFLPAICHQDIKTMGDVIWDYRYDKGSIANCSYTYPELPALMDKLAFLKKDGYVEILAISSVGPAIFVITKNTEKCIATCEENGIRVISTKINNSTYKVEKLI